MLPTGTGSILSRFVMLRQGKQAALTEIYRGDSEARHVAHASDTAARSQRLCALQLELSTASGLR
jgi:hypothetical protein